MTADEAIKIKEEMHELGLAPYDEASFVADKMSIEALKVVNRYSFKQRSWEGKLLPGETEEGG